MVRLWVICAIIIEMVTGEMSLSESPCYKPKPINYRMGLRIVGGSETFEGATPYMVGLMKHGGIVCGASIISEKFLILAAHCVCNNQNSIIKPTQLKAFIGMHKLSDTKLLNDNEIDDDGIREVYIDKIIVHPGYVCGKKAENDIGEIAIKSACNVLLKIFDVSALLHLKNPIKFNQNVQPLCLSTDDKSPLETGTVTGWGWTNENFNVGEKPNVLQTADVPVWDNEECQMSYKNMMKGNQISENQMCAGGKNGGVDCEINVCEFNFERFLENFSWFTSMLVR